MLTLENISKSFGGLQALSNVSFEVPEGLVTSLIGPNGSGKTTLFNCISNISPPSEGRIIYKHNDITSWPSHRIASAGLGRTFQNIQLFFNLNAVENVMAAHFCRTRDTFFDALLSLPRHRSERKRTQELAEEMLQWVGMYERRFELPKSLSFGYQRRLEIARALMTEPDLLMLDEPAAGLTGGGAKEVMELIGRLTEKGKTVFLIEHNMNLVMSISDKVVVLNFGHKIAEGTAAEVRANPAVIEAYLGAEA